jgi:glutaredoxin-like YruB-family protein
MPRKPGPRPKRVTVYTTPTCPWCRVAKAYLSDRDITFVEADINSNMKARREMALMTGQYGVPVIRVGEKAMIGWNAEEFERLWAR